VLHQYHIVTLSTLLWSTSLTSRCHNVKQQQLIKSTENEKAQQPYQDADAHLHSHTCSASDSPPPRHWACHCGPETQCNYHASLSTKSGVIAQAVFLVEHGRTIRHTDTQSQMPQFTLLTAQPLPASHNERV